MKSELLIKALVASAAAACVFGVHSAKAAEPLTIVSWGGAYSDSQRKAYYEPYMKQTGVKITEEEYDAELGKLKAMKEAGNVTWDVIDVDSAHALSGCDEGLFEKLDYSKIADTSKFLPGTALDCAVGTIAYSTIFAFNADVYKDNQPSVLEDLFDTKKYPGKRALLKKPFGNLEWALLADGVPAGDVYKLLATPEGVDRAFKKLDTIKSDIVWWEAGAQPPELLANGQVVMTSAFNGRIGNAIKEGKNFKIVWDRQEFDWDYWAIPADSKHVEGAYDFIKFASDPKNMSQQSKYIAYAPTRVEAIAMVDPKIAPTLPTYPENMKTAVTTDLQFWADNNEDLTKRFNAWLAQ
ncbi:ABC transporter substrate-binding protein [Mesorhizobium tamadayense]|nr:ABC transporter substrate-binding protein [Mesorhizobium tamadayense]